MMMMMIIKYLSGKFPQCNVQMPYKFFKKAFPLCSGLLYAKTRGDFSYFLVSVLICGSFRCQAKEIFLSEERNVKLEVIAY